MLVPLKTLSCCYNCHQPSAISVCSGGLWENCPLKHLSKVEMFLASIKWWFSLQYSLEAMEFWPLIFTLLVCLLTTFQKFLTTLHASIYTIFLLPITLNESFPNVDTFPSEDTLYSHFWFLATLLVTVSTGFIFSRLFWHCTHWFSPTILVLNTGHNLVTYQYTSSARLFSYSSAYQLSSLSIS